MLIRGPGVGDNCSGRLRCLCLYLHIADSSFLERTVLKVVGADVTIFAPVTRKGAAHTGSTPEERERKKETGSNVGEPAYKCLEISHVLTISSA